MSRTPSHRSTIILPSENQTREFDAKLLLACVLAERGHKVIIGARHCIHNQIADFKPGVYVAKDFRRPSERILPLIAGLGHSIVAWDEEGLVQPQPELYYARRYSLKAIAHVQSCFAWGPANRLLMEGAPRWPHLPIHNSGNPRLDLLRPELRAFHTNDVDRLRARYGRFVLFDSNFASFNPALGNVAPVLFDKGAALSPLLTARKHLFERWQKLIPQLANAIAPVKIIVRPHPAESHEIWNEISKGLSNVTVAHEGSALAWILASDVMLHSGCTTGVESAFMGHPAVSFRPVNLTELSADLPDSLSKVVATEAALVAEVRAILAGRKTYALTAHQQVVAENAAFARNGALASDRIADVLADMEPRGGRTTSAVTKARIRQFEKWLTGLNPNHKTSARANALRYPGISADEVAQKIAVLRSTLRRFESVSSRPVAPHIYCVGM
jgi:surface carbohydrate biosynthesis protein